MQIRDDTWFISDTHFGYNRLIKSGYRLFSSVKEMDEYIIDKWNEVVGKKDQVMFLGDFADFDHKSDFTIDKKVQCYKKHLNGEIIILLGNHDRVRSVQWWLDAGFTEVIEHPIVCNDSFILSHEPDESVSPELPLLNIHGHIHRFMGYDDKKHYDLTNNYFNVNADHALIDYTPIRFSEIIQKWKDFRKSKEN
jgi:calcineurin-like phosphoesterase family protein